MAQKTFNWDQCLQHAAISDVGMRRANNQDSYAEMLAGNVESWYERGHVFLVADGMGAHAAGELASRLAAEGVPHLYYKHRELAPPEAIHRAIQETNTHIHRRGQANAELYNMGTTTSVLLLLPQGVLVAHVGDSRVYRLRGEQLQQLTFDHSLVWELQASGQLTDNGEAPPGIPKNVITRSLGPHPAVQVDLEGPFPVQVDDVFLLCTDGLTGKVEDRELGPLLSSLPPDEAVQVLVDLANLRGGPDNITVIVAKVIGAEITTRVSQAEPLTVGGDLQLERRVHPALWIVAGVCLLASVGMMIAQQPVPALLAVLGAVVAGAVGVLQKFGAGNAGVSLTAGRRLGHGPHRRCECPVNRAAVDHLRATILDLSTSRLGEEPWSHGGHDFSECLRRAEQLAHRKDYAPAIRQCGQAVRLLMEEVRQRRGRKTSDSSLDFLS